MFKIGADGPKTQVTNGRIDQLHPDGFPAHPLALTGKRRPPPLELRPRMSPRNDMYVNLAKAFKRWARQAISVASQAPKGRPYCDVFTQHLLNRGAATILTFVALVPHISGQGSSSDSASLAHFMLTNQVIVLETQHVAKLEGTTYSEVVLLRLLL